MSAPVGAIAAIIAKTQEDYAGLWEIPTVLRTVGVEDARGTAVSLVRELLKERLVACIWGDPHPSPNRPVGESECERVLLDETYWSEDVPFAGVTVWLYATAKGEQWLEEHFRVSGEFPRRSGST